MNPVYARQREYWLNRWRNDLTWRMKQTLRARIRTALKGKRKSTSSMVLIGCSMPEFFRWIEDQFLPGMSWENYGPVWHIDHIRPCATYDLLEPDQQRACFHYTNLQPLFATDNLRKGAKWEGRPRRLIGEVRRVKI